MIAQQFWLLIHCGAAHMQIIYLLKVSVNMIHGYFYQLDIESLENYTSMIIRVLVIYYS